MPRSYFDEQYDLQMPLVPSSRSNSPSTMVGVSSSDSRNSLDTLVHRGDLLVAHGSRHRDQETEEHPIYDPKRVTCSFCGSRGHSLMNCKDRLDLHLMRTETHCKYGWHKPHLHDRLDLWRCEWCLTHLKTTYVKKWYPNAFEYEKDKTAAQLAKNLARYSDTDSGS